MSFKVKDLMFSVGPMEIDDASTCTLVTRTTGGACVDSVVFQGNRVRQELSQLKAQLRQAARRA